MADSIAILQRDELPYLTTNSARIVCRITGGVNISGEYIRSVDLHVIDSITTPDHWEVTLHSRVTPNGADQALLWTSPDQGEYDLSFTYGDLDPDDEENVRCLVLRVKCITEADSYTFIGKAADSPHYGVAITSMDLRASDAASMAPEDVIKNLITPFTNYTQRSFLDASGIVIGQLNFSEPTTRYDCIVAVNDLLRWQWGFGPDGVFTYRRPWTAANVPDAHCYDLPYSLAMPTTEASIDDTWNAVEVSYKDAKQRQKIYRERTTSEALGTTIRRQPVPAPDNVHGAVGAEKVADASLADHAEPMPTGTVQVAGLVPLLDGRERHALHIRPGEFVFFRDAPSEEERMVRITRIERDVDGLSASLEYGRNPNRLDRLMARWMMKTHRAARK